MLNDQFHYRHNGILWELASVLVKTRQGSNKLPSLNTRKTNLGVVRCNVFMCHFGVLHCAEQYNSTEISRKDRIKEDAEGSQVTSPGTALLHLSSTWSHLSQPALKK